MIAPAAVTTKFLPIPDVPNIVALLLVRLTSLAPLLLKETAPVKTLFKVKVIAFAPALKLEAPGTVNIPVCVIGPVAVAVKLLPTLDAANTKPMLFVTLTLLVTPELLKVTAPVNALACVKVIGFAPAVKFAVPATVAAPVCVIAPEAITTKFLPTVEVPKTNALPLVIATSFAPLLLKLTAPVNAFACVNVIGLAPALKLEVPATVNAPDCVMAPLAIAAKLPTLEAVNAKAVLLVMLATLPAPLLLNVTAPVNTLLNVKVIAFATALKLDVPGTVKIPVCEIAPVAVAVKF